MIRVRFAPSPTGNLHIGGARTALFNWMYAKAQGGKFILRIEDTDQLRSKSEYLDEIMNSMKWLGLSWDEFYKQSDRFDIYRQYAQKLLDEGKAYKDGDAILFKMQKREAIIDDLIRGKIVFDTSVFYKRTEEGEIVLGSDGQPVLKDEVLMKADGSPSYGFACVVDDSLMEISHVIRGEDHISNTPKQILLYDALGFKAPKFAHLPLIMDPEGGRMSKRAGATAVTEYRNLGFLPQAVVNYLMLLGWSPGNNQEKVVLEQAVKNFSIKKINKAGAAFDMEKLSWLNGQYIKEMPDDKLAVAVIPFLEAAGTDTKSVGTKKIENIVHLYKSRMSTLNDIVQWTRSMFIDEVIFDEGAKEQYLSNDMGREFGVLADALAQLQEYDLKTTEAAFRSAVAGLGVEAGTLVHPVRVALTGKAVGPGLFDTMMLLGQEKTIARLRATFKK